MTAFSRFDRYLWYLELARQAKARALASPDREVRAMWLDMANSWEFLATLQNIRCFCGRPSIGYKVFPNGEKQAACSTHLREFITQSILTKMGCKKPN